MERLFEAYDFWGLNPIITVIFYDCQMARVRDALSSSPHTASFDFMPEFINYIINFAEKRDHDVIMIFLLKSLTQPENF